MKTDIKEIGETHDGLPLYKYRYKGSGETKVGPMAQDVEKVRPEAVQKIGGIRFLDMSKTFGEAA